MRNADQISQAELARKHEVTRQFLNAVEMGLSAVGLDFAKKIADAFGYSVEPFAEILIQEQLKKAGIKYKVALKSGMGASFFSLCATNIARINCSKGS
jgi:DNA-binding XRE family transcriptional regulator